VILEGVTTVDDHCYRGGMCPLRHRRFAEGRGGKKVKEEGGGGEERGIRIGRGRRSQSRWSQGPDDS